MWLLTVKLRDPAEADTFLDELDARSELDSGTVLVARYPDDGQAVIRSVQRTPLASLTAWAVGFTSARLALTEESPGSGQY